MIVQFRYRPDGTAPMGIAAVNPEKVMLVSPEAENKDGFDRTRIVTGPDCWIIVLEPIELVIAKLNGETE